MFTEGNASTWSHWRKAFSKYDLTSVFIFSLVADVDDVLAVVLLYQGNCRITVCRRKDWEEAN